MRADALLLNYKALAFTFTPDPARGVATIGAEPPLAGVRVDASVPLAAGPCDDWRGALRADFTDPLRLRFAGAFPAACGEKAWPVAYADPKSYNERALAGLWQEMGGKLAGTVRDGRRRPRRRASSCARRRWPRWCATSTSSATT